MSYADITITCRDCGEEFIFTAGEQEFYAQKGFLNNPVRCPRCRRERKRAYGDDHRKEDRRQPPGPREPKMRSSRSER